MQIWAESGKSALPICNYSQILYQFLTFTQNLRRSHKTCLKQVVFTGCVQSGVLQNKFPTGNESVPSPAGDQSIFS